MAKYVSCCRNCEPCSKEFKNNVDLNHSELIVYLHGADEQKPASLLNTERSILLHNTTGKKIEKSEYGSELHRYHTRCDHCKIIIQKVKSVLNEVVAIREHDIISICKHCRRANTTKKCKRCDYIVSKFVTQHRDIIEERRAVYKEWLIKVNTLLKAILNAHYACHHMLYKDAELERILEQLKTPLSTRMPNIELWPYIEDQIIMQNISESQIILDDILNRIKIVGLSKPFTSEDSLYPSPSIGKRPCLCKLLKTDQLLEKEVSITAKENEENLLERLTELQKEISLGKFKGFDYHLLDMLLAAISDAKRYGLIPDVIKSLLEQLKKLKGGLFDGEGIPSILNKNLNDLIIDLENRFIDSISIQLIDVLADVAQILAQNISEGVEKANKKIKQKSLEQTSGGILDKRKDIINIRNNITCQEIDKDLAGSLNKDIVTTLLDLSKELKPGLSQGIDGKNIQDLSKKLINFISTSESNTIKIMIKNLSDICKTVAPEIPKNVNMINIEELITDINKIIQQKLSTEQDKMLLCKYLKKLCNNLFVSSRKLSESLFSKDTQRSSKKEKIINTQLGRKEQIEIEPKEVTESERNKTKHEAEYKKTHHIRADIEQMLANKVRKSKYSRDKSLNQKTAKKYDDLQPKEIKKAKHKAAALLSDLPQIQIPKPASSASLYDYVECQSGSDSPKLIVIGTSLKPYSKIIKKFMLPHIPLKGIDARSVPSDSGLQNEAKILPMKKKAINDVSGILKYQLSNKEFIDKGWTQLPTMKIMRRINIYKMEAVKPENNWFERHKNDKILYYSSGETFAKIEEDGHCKWFYKNGSLALDYYNSQDLFSGQRVIVYSSGDECENGKLETQTILATFDYIGNAVIYDFNGNIRLKYNQTEGVINDRQIGPLGRWKWHTLNDPPVIEQVFTELIEQPLYSMSLSSEKNLERTDKNMPVYDDPMIQIELDNYVKAQIKKINQPYQPFQIKMKAAKLNNHFSIRILDQSKILLIYREGSLCLKLNLGMHLNSREVIDSQLFEMADVVTPYDITPT